MVHNMSNCKCGLSLLPLRPRYVRFFQLLLRMYIIVLNIEANAVQTTYGAMRNPAGVDISKKSIVVTSAAKQSAYISTVAAKKSCWSKNTNVHKQLSAS